MSFEFLSGMLATLSSIVALVTAIFRINRAILRFEESLERLDYFAKEQKRTNETYDQRLSACEAALSVKRKGEARNENV